MSVADTEPAVDLPAQTARVDWRGRRRQRSDSMLNSYGQTLFTLAYVVLEDRPRAEELVLQTVFASHAGRLAHLHRDSRDDLRELAHYVYLRCVADLGTRTAPPRAPVADPSGGSALLSGLMTMTSERRAAIALCMFGGHSYVQAAELLNLSAARVAEHLEEALFELEPNLDAVIEPASEWEPDEQEFSTGTAGPI